MPRIRARSALVLLAIALAPAAPAPRAAAAPANSTSLAKTSAPAKAAAARAAANPALAESLRLDSHVRTGILPNGLRTFVRRNGRPEARVSLRLAILAGSNVEEDDQQGLAHFVEHMAFNGSEHFRPDELVSYLRSIGLRFGPDANAYTSFDETVYMLDVPTDRESLLVRGLEALSDFAGRATLTDAEIDKERGVVLEEWRLGQGANERLLRKQFPVLFRGSRHASRLPIGKPDVIRGAPATRLRDYYRDWYAPDRMAVVAVGDVDPARMDSLIRGHFSDLPPSARKKPTQVFDVPRHKETLMSIATDPEATGTDVAVYSKHPRRPDRTAADYRRGLIENLFGAMLNGRFGEIARRADAPFLNAGGFSTSLGRTHEAWVLAADVADGGAERGLAAILEEMARVRRHGFLAAELAREREELRAITERAYAEREKTESAGIASRLVSAFLTDEPAPGIEDRYRLTKSLLDGITLAEVNALAAELMHDDNRVVLVTAPEKPGARMPPSEANLRAVLDRAGNTRPAAWVDRVAKRALGPPEKPGRIASRRSIEPLGVTVLTLSNGVEVWLKPTDFKADEIVITSWAPGGLSLADSAAFATAWMSSAAVSAMGIGGFTSVELQKLTAGKLVNAPAYLGFYTHGINGSTRPADLETELQLIQLTFAGPTRDREAFTALKNQYREFLTERVNSPEQVYADTVNSVNTGHFYMQRIPTVAEVDSVKLDQAADFFAARYRNAADFTFFVAGAFQVDSIAPLVARYLGALPSPGRRTGAYRAIGPRFPHGVRKVEVRRGLEPKANTRITFFAEPPGLEELDLHRGRAAASILSDLLRERLREKLGGTYGASASFAYLSPLPGWATMSVAFGSAPENVEAMVDEVLTIVRRLREEGPSASDVRKAQEVERRELEVSQRQNPYWSGSLLSVHQLGWDPLRVLERRKRIDLLNTENLRETCRKYFPMDRYTVISLLPAPQDSTRAPAR
jgi:zinc protease